jgi:hypothetical protein
MWILFARAPSPDAPYWPGRRLLASVDAVGWPRFWVGVFMHAPKPTGIVPPIVTAIALLYGLGRLRLALSMNHRYRFTTWRWGRLLAALLLLGAMTKLLALA